MQVNQNSPSSAERRDQEIRAAVDVMFEALSHIQASLESRSGEDHVQSYQKFKEALYERFEHAVDRRREEKPTFERHEEKQETISQTDPSPNGSTPKGAANGVTGNGSAANGSAANKPVADPAGDKPSSGEPAREESGTDSDDDTLGKLWPTIAEQAEASG